MLKRNLQISVFPQGFLHKPLLEFVGFKEFEIPWIDFSENHFDPSFLKSRFNAVDLPSINYQLDIKLGEFTQELDVVQIKIKNRKAAGL